MSSDDKLLNALESGDFETALPLLPKDSPLITIGPEGFTPLHYASRHGEAEVTRLLIAQYYYSIKSTSNNGQTPAHVAAKYGHVDTLRALIESAYDTESGKDNCIITSAPNTISDITSLGDKEGNTPLLIASACGQLPVVKYLLTDLQCSPVCTNLAIETPLHLAAKNGHLHVIKYLVDEVGCPTTPVDEYGGTPLYTASECGQIKVVKYLVEEKACDPYVYTAKRWEGEWKGIKCVFSAGRTPLHTASQEGHLNIVYYLVNELKCDPSCRDEDGASPLYLASQQGHLAIVKFLVIDYKCDPNIALNDGRSPLHVASQNGHLALVYFLTEKGCNPLGKSKHGDSPVSLAALNGRLDVLKFFITTKGCDPMVRGLRSKNLVHYASEEGHFETVQYLINEHQVDPSCQDEDDETPLHLASKSGHLPVVRFLTEKGCDPLIRDKYSNTPVSYAALNGRLDVLKFFITEKGCDPLVRGWQNRSLVHYASERGHLETLQYLINELQVDPSCQDEINETPLHLASQNGHLAVVCFLTEKGCNPLTENKHGSTPISDAALYGRLDVLNFFITEKGCDPMVRGQWNSTLVHFASDEGHLETVQYLINEHQVDPSYQDEDDETPLHIASQNGHLPVVRFLTEKGCDPLARDKHGNTPVSYGAFCGRLDVLKFFITEKGCNPMVRDQWNRTLAHLASEGGHLETVQYLVNEHQVDPSIQDDDNETPLQLASMNGHLPVVHFLTEKGCDPLAKSKIGATPISEAAFYGKLNVLKFFITEKGCDPMERGLRSRNLVHHASEEGHFETVQYLINEHQVDPSCQDEDDETPLHLASQNGHLAVVCFLTEKGCDPLARNKHGSTPVSDAALFGRLNVLKFFITEKGCDPMGRNQWNRTLAHLASQEGHLETVQYLINQHQVDPLCQDENSDTPFHLASMNGHLPVVRFLAERGCDPLATNKSGLSSVSITALFGRLNILKFFITDKGCDPMAGQFNITLVHYASQEGHLDIIQYLISEHQVDPSCQDVDDETPLHIASRNGHLPVVRFLIDKSCDPLIRDKYHNTPVSYATLSGRLDVLKFFITEKGCDPLVRGWQNRSLVHYASERGHLETVQYLINELQVDPSCQDEKNETPLHLASQNGHLEVVHFLTEKGCNPLDENKHCNTPISYAALFGRLDILKFFITEKGCDPMVRGQWNSALVHFASDEGHLETVQYLINEHKVNPSCQDEDSETPLHLASRNGHLPVVRFLTEKGCDPLARDKHGNSPVSYGAFCGRLDVLKFFIIEKGCDPMVRDQWNRTLAHLASEGGHLETVQSLINEHQVDPSIQDDDDETPLHLASKNGHLPVVRFLTEKGCDPLSRNKDGNTPVSEAALNRGLDVLKFFITEKGCDPMARDQWNRTLVHLASEEGYLEAVQYLINEHQVDPLHQDEDSMTPLHLASMNGHLRVVRSLAEKGWDPLAQDKDGITSVNYAALNGRLDVLKYFITEKDCDPIAVRDKWGHSLLHDASRSGHLETLQYLINEHHLNPSCQDEVKDTPLHIASKNGMLPIVQFLSEKGCDPFISNIHGSTPVSIAACHGRLEVLKLITETEFDPVDRRITVLHVAVQEGHLEIVQYFIGVKRWDPLIKDRWGRTPVHIASSRGHLKIVKYLINDCEVDPSCHSNGGNTPLHLASQSGHLEVVKYLVEEAFCDPSEATTDSQRNTPMTLACKQHHEDIVLYLYSKGESLPKGYNTSKPLLDNRVKIYCIGNRSMGKSTLVKALSGKLKAAWFGSVRDVSDVSLEKAGIAHLEFDSGIYGKVTFYDFAGHKEYYASHEVIFDKDSHPVILLTVNVSEDDKTICNNLRFWRHFLANAVLSSGCQAHVIIVGSHVDLVSSQKQAKKAILMSNFESSQSLTVIDGVLLDCRKSSSRGMSKLCQVLKKACKTVRIKSQVDYQKGGILIEFIRTHLHGVSILTFIDLYSRVLSSPVRNVEPLVSPEVLLQTCECLSVSGHILLLGNQEVQEESWVILQKEVILFQVHRLLKHLKQYTELGIVPLSLIDSLLQKHAQGLSPDLAIKYMKKMVFCLEIAPQALACIKNFPLESVYEKEKYFFFSSLVSVEKPSQVLDWNPKHFTYISGWNLKCTNPDHFFTPMFLQVLQIELACQFALKLNDSSPVRIEPKQGCKIWKNGISWLDHRGIEALAEVDKVGKSLCLTLKSLEEVKLQCVKLRSELIHLILNLKKKLCRDLELEEYFLHPEYFKQSGPPSPLSESKTSPPEGVLLPVAEVAKALLYHDYRIVREQTLHERPFLSIEELLYFEPYHGIGAELLLTLYNPHNEHNIIEKAVYEKLTEALHVHWECMATALNTRQSTIAKLRKNNHATDCENCFELFMEWSGGKGTYSALRHDLDQYSTFRGRSILEAFPDHEQQMIQLSLEELGTEEQQQEHQPLPPHADLALLLESTDTCPIGIESLLEVRTEVASVVSHSTELGVALGLCLESTIYVLQEQDIAHQFTEIIAAWLKGEDQAGTPSWRSLTNALITPTVDCPHIARRIAERHPSGSGSSTVELSYSISKIQFQNVDNSALDTNSSKSVIDALWELSHDWFHLGLVFGLTYGRLKSIQRNCKKTGACIIEVVSSWLSLRDQVLQQGRPSWRTLVRALTHPLVKEMKLAEDLAASHKARVEESGDATTPVPLSSLDSSHPPPSHSTASST